MIVGYVAYDSRGLLELVKDDKEFPKGGVLMHGDTVTLFKNRYSVKQAIQRSQLYSDRKGFDWEKAEFKRVLKNE